MQTDACMLLNLPAKCFQDSCYLEKKKRFLRQISNWICWEYDGRGKAKDGAARSSRTYSARLHAAACTTQDVSVDIGFAMHRGILQFSFRLASSLFRQLVLLSLAAFQSSSIFNPRFHFFPSLSVWSALFPNLRHFRIEIKPAIERDAQRKRRRKMKLECR